MAAIDTPRAQQNTAGFAGLIGHPLATLFAALLEWRSARATRATLLALSDRDLDDIGLSRTDIYNIR